MQKYELLTVIPGTKTQEEAASVVDGIKDIIAAQNGTGIEIESMGKNRIAFPIQHIRYGFFYNIYFDADPSMAQTIQNKLRLETGLLRAEIIKINPALIEVRKKRGALAPEHADAGQAPAHQPAATAPAEPREARHTRTTVSRAAAPEKEAPLPSTYNADAAPVPAPAPVVARSKEALANLDEKIDKILDEEFIKDL